VPTAFAARIDPSETGGYWKTEQESAQAFDDAIEGLGGLFRVYREVEGRYQHLRPSQKLQTPPIDRILVPTNEIKARGWTLGPIGVEIKASQVKLGPPLCQIIDYSRAAWSINGSWVIPEWYFLWPTNKLSGPLQSVLAGQRCGGIYRDQYQRLVFHSAFVLAKLSSEAIDCRPDNANHGRKVGSR
jgi:hypothetical protein